MTALTTANAIRAARDNSGAAHESAIEMIDAIMRMSDVTLRYEFAASAPKTPATETLLSVLSMADIAKKQVIEADSELWVMSEQIDALPGAQPRPAGIPTAQEVRAEDFADAERELATVEAALAAFDRDHMTPANKANDAGEITFEAHQLVQDEFDKIVDQQSAAIDKFLLAPAPDLDALSRKLQVFVRHEIFEGWDNRGNLSRQLAADAARLATANG